VMPFDLSGGPAHTGAGWKYMSHPRWGLGISCEADRRSDGRTGGRFIGGLHAAH
jgi:hypothetical protein